MIVTACSRRPKDGAFDGIVDPPKRGTIAPGRRIGRVRRSVTDGRAIRAGPLGPGRRRAAASCLVVNEVQLEGRWSCVWRGLEPSVVVSATPLASIHPHSGP